MTQITLVFQAGFDDDTVMVTLNQHIQHVRHLTTDYSIGVARKLTFPAEPKDNELLLHYPDNNQTVEVHLDANTPVFVLVELSPDKVLTAETVEQAGYQY